MTFASAFIRSPISDNPDARRLVVSGRAMGDGVRATSTRREVRRGHIDGTALGDTAKAALRALGPSFATVDSGVQSGDRPGTAFTLNASSASAGAATSDWTVYHHDVGGSGVDTSGALPSAATPAWTSAPLDGQVYGEPLVAGSLVYVTTENDTVDALEASNGALVWSTHLGTPVPSSALPCGDIAPRWASRPRRSSTRPEERFLSWPTR